MSGQINKTRDARSTQRLRTHPPSQIQKDKSSMVTLICGVWDMRKGHRGKGRTIGDVERKGDLGGEMSRAF